MNIYKARKLQKLLYKRSNSSFKRARTRTFDGVLYYTVMHHIINDSAIRINENVIRRVNNNTKDEVETSIEFVNKEINPHIPEGMYAVEFIKID